MISYNDKMHIKIISRFFIVSRQKGQVLFYIISSRDIISSIMLTALRYNALPWIYIIKCTIFFYTLGHSGRPSVMCTYPLSDTTYTVADDNSQMNGGLFY